MPIISKNFIERCLFGTLSIALATCAISFSHNVLGAFFFLAIVLAFHSRALYEYCHLCEHAGHSLLKTNLFLFSNLYILSHAFFTHRAAFILIIGTVFIITSYFRKQEKALEGLALTALSFVMITFPMSLFINLNYLPRLINGTATSFWLFWLLIVVKGSDMAAYVVGKKMGSHPLAKDLSPKKTIEGAVGGVLFAGALSVILGLLYRKMFTILMPPDTWVILGMIFGVIAIFGDLTESLLKRSAGVKDSARIPGLGGIFDTYDSLLLTTPALYFYLRVMELI